MMRDKRNRLGINNSMLLIEQLFIEQIEEHLNAVEVVDFRARGYVAGNYPPASWEKFVGFVPDNDFHYQVTIGLAVESGEKPQVLALALIDRDKESKFRHLIWKPSDSDISYIFGGMSG